MNNEEREFRIMLESLVHRYFCEGEIRLPAIIGILQVKLVDLCMELKESELKRAEEELD